MTIAREEIFGPVLSILPYKDEAEAIRIANDTIYGLAAYVQSGDRRMRGKVAAECAPARCIVNYPAGDTAAPFGGYKQSGNGREYGEWALDEFTEIKASSATPELKLYIGGEWRSRDGQPVINPADESILGTVPHATRADLDDALAAAEEGFKVWSRTSPAKRAEIILGAARLCRERVEDMAVAMTLEQGKPIAQSRRSPARLRDHRMGRAGGPPHLWPVIPSEPGMRHSVLRQPIGVVAAFSPWNFPMSSPARKVGGALSAGCAIILKASEETPAGAVQLVQAFADAGLPPGVLNLVFGKPSDISEYLIPQPSVRLVTFTGSVPVGKHLAAMAGAHMKPAIMELGGHAPVIICNDVDPAATAATSVFGKSRNAGQVCVSPTRFFVQERSTIGSPPRSPRRRAALKVGDGLDPENDMGPLANERRIAMMEALVADAKAKGARVVAGGSGSAIVAISIR